MLLAGARSPEVAEYLEHSDMVLVPVGSLEQHGNAAPLACDTIIPVRLCAEAGTRTRTAVSPAVTFGYSPNHMGFPGTVSLRSSTLEALTVDISTSLYKHGFRRMLFVSGHGGNRGPLQAGLRVAAETCPGSDLRYIPYWALPGVQEKQKALFCPDPGYHVTVTEVSMVWHLMGVPLPEFERKAYPPEPPAGIALSAERWKELYPDGGAGSDLSNVSEEKGARLFKFIVGSLSTLIESIRRNAF